MLTDPNSQPTGTPTEQKMKRQEGPLMRRIRENQVCGWSRNG